MHCHHNLGYIGPNIIQPLTLVINYPFSFPIVAHESQITIQGGSKDKKET